MNELLIKQDEIVILDEINNLFKQISEIPNLTLQNDIFFINYTNITYINHGSDGVIYKAKHIIDDKFYALKKIKFFIKKSNPTEIMAKNILNKLKEIRYMSALEHPNIIKYYTSPIELNKLEYNMDDYEDDDTSCGSTIIINNETCYCICLFVQMELMDMSLREYLYKYDYEIRKQYNNIIIRSLLDSVHYIHNNGIIHRDLKPENILLNFKDNKIINIKIADFSLVIKKNNITYNLYKDGTPLYTPPENYNDIITTNYDIYSIGIIIYEIINPFKTYMEALDNIHKFIGGDYEKNKITNILYRMINNDYTKRISINNILNTKLFE